MSYRYHIRLFIIFAFLITSFSAAQALTINASMPITHTVTVQPIIVSDNDGSNTATFFGNPSQQSSIESFIDQIWSQAGIDVNFLSSSFWNNTFANWGAGGPPNNGGNARPVSDLNTMITDASTAGMTHTNPEVINMFFVNIPAGFGLLPLNSSAGLARLGGNGISQYVGSDLLTSSSGLEVIAGVVAHEIGHNLGLAHTTPGSANLMSPSGTTEQLDSSQIATALTSNLSVEIQKTPLSPATPVPVPAAVWLFGSSLLLLFRKRQAKSLTPVK